MQVAVSKRRRCGGRISHNSQCGSALVEFTIVVLFLVLALLVDDQGNPNSVLAELSASLKQVYMDFVYALSISWI